MSWRALQYTMVPSSAKLSSPSAHMVLIGAPKLCTASSTQLFSAVCPLLASRQVESRASVRRGVKIACIMAVTFGLCVVKGSVRQSVPVSGLSLKPEGRATVILGTSGDFSAVPLLNDFRTMISTLSNEKKKP